jgi:chromosome segregation ATPase
MPAPTPKEAPASEKQVEPKEDFSRPQDLQQIKELTDLVGDLEAENQRLKDVVAIGAWDATDIEKEDIEETVKDLREQIASLEREVRTLQASRDTYMNEVVELQRINKGLRNKLKQYE